MVIAPMVVAAKIRKYYSRFYNAGATDARNAKTLQSLGLHGSIIFNRMVNNQVFIEASPGYFYVNTDNYNLFRIKRRQRALTIASILILLLIAIFFFSTT